MTRFRPCIDLHQGEVKQLVGGTLRDDGAGLRTNFVAERPAHWFAERYCADGLDGGHVIMLGPGNERAAQRALEAWPGGLQIGGGISAWNAAAWIDAGAAKVIVTSWLFTEDGRFLPDRLEEMRDEVGRDRLVVDLSCKRSGGGWRVAMHRWQTLTNFELTADNLEEVEACAGELLVHAADVEGKCAGVDAELVAWLGEHARVPATYAGGARSLEDLELVQELSRGRLDVTIGSALDMFGGTGVRYDDCVAWNRGPLR